MSLKRCTHCLQELDIAYFSSFKNNKTTKTCYFCRKRQIPKNKKELHYMQLKKELPPCVQCGDDDPEHKDFDHQGEKVSEVNKMTTIKDIAKELAKCQVLCMKCHRKKTFQEIQNKKKKATKSMTKIALRRRKLRQRNYYYRCKRKIEIGGCQGEDCSDIFDQTNLMFYEFDHINPEEKRKCVSKIDGSLKILEEEIQKCVLLCGYCHRRKTREQFITMRNKKVNIEKPPKIRKKYNKLSFDQVLEMREKYASGKYTFPQLAGEYGSSLTRISDIINLRSRINR